MGLLQSRYNSSLEGMKVSGQLCSNPFAELRRLTGQESLQVGCHWLDHGTAVNGDFRVQFAVRPTNWESGETEARMNREPKKSCQYCPQGKDSPLERTMEPPGGSRCLGDGKLELLLDATPGQESGRSGPCSGAVKPGPDRAQQLGFPGRSS